MADTIKTRRAPRFRVSESDGGVTLTSTDADVLAALGAWEADEIRRTYWVTADERGGYVRSGDRQICEGLGRHGVTLHCRQAHLARVIRRELRRALRWHAAELAR